MDVASLTSGPMRSAAPRATEAVKKNVRLESALVRLARNQFTWGEMGRLRIVEWSSVGAQVRFLNGMFSFTPSNAGGSDLRT